MNRQFAVVMACLMLAYTGVTQAMPLVPPNLVKWSQSPDMDQGTDYLSMHRNDGPIVADDFKSDGRPISGFHWWGSYFTDPTTGQEWDAGQAADPAVDRNIGFEISFHIDCPAGSTSPDCVDPFTGAAYNYSTPSQNYQSHILNVEESFYGATLGQEDVYEYWVALPEPWLEEAGQIYWVDFAWDAAQATDFGLDPSADIWGWHESDMHWNDAAVQTMPPSPGGNPHLGPWTNLTHVDGSNVDMAFEVLTAVPVPAAVWLFGSGLLGLVGIARRKKA